MLISEVLQEKQIRLKKVCGGGGGGEGRKRRTKRERKKITIVLRNHYIRNTTTVHKL